MAFRFRLQAVLDWRREQDASAQRALGAARQALHDAEAAAAAAGARLADARNRTQLAEQAGCAAAARAWHWNWIVRCEHDVRRAADVVAERRGGVDRAAAAAQDARRALRTLERLRERALTGFDYQERRREQKALDALAVTGFIRLRHGSGETGVRRRHGDGGTDVSGT